MRLSLSLMLAAVVGIQASHGAPHSLTKTVPQQVTWTALMSGLKRMHLAMTSVEPSGKPDVDFVRLMLPHHQGAVEMAKAELLYGTDPQMRRLAQEIVIEQQSEVQLMELWLQRRSEARATEAQSSKEDGK
jgi:uncharacterized protein (DUF305 family)